MMTLRQLSGAFGVAFDYAAEAARLSMKAKDWTYVLITFGPGGVNPETLPLGTRDLLDAAFDDAAADDEVAYVAAFDKTEDDIVPTRVAYEDESFLSPSTIVRKITNTTVGYKKYGKYILGAIVLSGGLLLVGKWRGRKKPALAGRR